MLSHGSSKSLYSPSEESEINLFLSHFENWHFILSLYQESKLFHLTNFHLYIFWCHSFRSLMNIILWSQKLCFFSYLKPNRKSGESYVNLIKFIVPKCTYWFYRGTLKLNKKIKLFTCNDKRIMPVMRKTSANKS